MPGRNSPVRSGKRGDVNLDDFQLPGERQPGKCAVRAETGVVHQHVHRHSPALQFREHALRGFGRERSAVRTSASILCAWRNSPASASSASVLRASKIKRQPSAAKHFASSSPMPDEAPVIKTVSLVRGVHPVPGGLLVSPPEPFGDGPVNEEGFADDTPSGKSPQNRESRLFIVLSPMTNRWLVAT